MALVLTIIAVVAGAALAAVNAVTAPQIEKINADNLAAGIKSVMGSDNITVADPQEKTATVAGKEKTFNIYNVTDANGASLGKAVQTSENGFGGELQVLVGFDNEGTILGYTILQHAETPGLGAKAGDCQQGWWRHRCHHRIHHHLSCFPACHQERLRQCLCHRCQYRCNNPGKKLRERRNNYEQVLKDI